MGAPGSRVSRYCLSCRSSIRPPTRAIEPVRSGVSISMRSLSASAWEIVGAGVVSVAGAVPGAVATGGVATPSAPVPPADWPAYILLGGIMVVGFILEGMRMAMTGSPDGASWAFAGDLISRMLAGYELTGLYGYVWYLHAILTGAFVIYLPFSRMFHLIMAPVTLAINAASDAHKPAG